MSTPLHFKTRSDTLKLRRLIEVLRVRGSDLAEDLERKAHNFLTDVQVKINGNVIAERFESDDEVSSFAEDVDEVEEDVEDDMIEEDPAPQPSAPSEPSPAVLIREATPTLADSKPQPQEPSPEPPPVESPSRPSLPNRQQIRTLKKDTPSLAADKPRLTPDCKLYWIQKHLEQEQEQNKEEEESMAAIEEEVKMEIEATENSSASDVMDRAEDDNILPAKVESVKISDEAPPVDESLEEASTTEKGNLGVDVEKCKDDMELEVASNLPTAESSTGSLPDATMEVEQHKSPGEEHHKQPRVTSERSKKPTMAREWRKLNQKKKSRTGINEADQKKKEPSEGERTEDKAVVRRKYVAPVYAENELYQDRLGSFDSSWPHCNKKGIATPSELAEAGFFLVGPGDFCKCFQCGLELNCWEPFESPWVRHGFLSQDCSYVQRIKGIEWIESVTRGEF